MIKQLNSGEFELFLKAKRAAVVCFDAKWDIGYRETVRRQMGYAEELLGQQVNFGEIDCDREHALTRSLNILNVPTVAYFIDGTLVAALIGADQDVRRRLESLLNGGRIGYKDGFDNNHP
jgi:thioredoxin-like negative regulator of GroEL